MPPKKRSSEAAEEYESDDGFVEDAPKSKKPKTTKSAKGEKSSRGSKGDVGNVGGGGEVSKDGEVFWELSGKRRVGITEFKGNLMVNIREYYEKDGEMLPGKKGISLPVEQFNTIINLLPHIEPVLAEKGQKVVRPDYNATGGSAVGVGGGDGADDEEVKGKKNFEETSDEEE